MKKINEHTKVTLTMGQLKRLVKEEETRAERLRRLATSHRAGRGDSKAKAELQWRAYQKNLDRITKCCMDHDDLDDCSVRDLIEFMGANALIVSSVKETGKVGILCDDTNNLKPTEFEEDEGLGGVGIGYVVNEEGPNNAVVDVTVFSSGPEIAFCEGELGPDSFTKEEYLNDPEGVPKDAVSVSYQDIFRAVQGLADGLEEFFKKVEKAIDELPED